MFFKAISVRPSFVWVECAIKNDKINFCLHALKDFKTSFRNLRCRGKYIRAVFDDIVISIKIEKKYIIYVLSIHFAI